MRRLCGLSLLLFALGVLPALHGQSPAPETSGVAAAKVEGLELSPASQEVAADADVVIVRAVTRGRVQWLVLSSGKLTYETKGKSLLLYGPFPADGATVLAVALDGTKLSPFATAAVTVSGGSPPVPPAPSPTPPQPPPQDAVLPSGTKLYVTVIEEGAVRTPTVAAVLTSSQVRNVLAAAGHVFRVYDVGDPAVTTRGFARVLGRYIAEKRGEPSWEQRPLADLVANHRGTIPFLVMQTVDGKVRFSGLMPQSENGFLDAVKKVVP